MRSDHPYINPTVIHTGLQQMAERSLTPVANGAAPANFVVPPVIEYGWLGVSAAITFLVNRKDHPIVWWLFGMIPLAGGAGRLVYRLAKKTGVEE